MVRVLAMIVGGLLLFSAGLVGTLGVRGKLNAETLDEFLGRHQAEEAPVDPHAVAEAPTTPTGGEGEQSGHGEPGSEHAMPAPAADVVRDAVAATPIVIEAPFSDEETRRLFDELRAARGEVLEARAQNERDRRDLELVRLDLNRRWDEVELREQKFEERVRSIAAERTEIEQRTVLLKEAEVENLQQLARNVEKMSAEGAAKMLMEKTPERAALILHYVKPRETGKILDAMARDYASLVAERMLGILEPDVAKNGGGN